MDEEKTERYWSRFSETYDANQEYVVNKDLLDEIKDNLNELSDLGGMVEFGCGTGYFTETIAQKANRIVATDLSDELLEQAKRRLEKNQKVTFQKENCVKTSFGSGEFDSVFMANLIHVIEDPLGALQESHRICKDGGVLIIVTYTNYGMKWLEKIKLVIRFLKRWGKPPRHVRVFSPEELAGLIEKAEFTVEKSKLLGNRTKALYLVGKKKGVEEKG